MGRKSRLMILVVVLAAISVTLVAYEANAEGEAGRVVRKMTVTGQIVKVENGYVVRGTAQAVIFTVLNPDPKILDGLADSGKTVVVDVYIVSGDNVNIEKIDGKEYAPNQ